MGAGPPKNNKNAEKWTFEDAESFLNEALELSKNREYDFVGEIAKELGSYHNIFGYLLEKFPALKPIHSTIYANCEANCFYNGKKGNINSALAIMNLKSNHKWTDRNATDHTTNGESIKQDIDYSKLSKEALHEIANLPKPE